MGATGHQPSNGSARNGGAGPLRTPLPFPMSTVVGRIDEVAAIRRLLGVHRLVTVTGAPGVGKSRVAYEVASGGGDEAEDGPYWVDLAEVAESDELVQALAGALGVAGDRRPLPDAVVEATAGRRALLVLDNVDLVLAACADLVRSLLTADPQLRVLVTSRERLAVAGEEVVLLFPLPVPTVDPEGRVTDLAGTALDLFQQRARTVRPGFVLDEATTPVVADICRRLDGLPLAVELAAGRAGVLSPQQIAAGLDDHARLLKASPRAATARHRSMEAALSWSHDQLSSPEQVLLRRLAVFRSGCTMEAAEAVCAGGALDPDSVLDALERLVARSLVVAETSGEQARYRLLEVVRYDSLRQVREAGEAPELVERWTGWCVSYAEQSERELAGPDEVRWLHRIDADRANLDAALQWAVRRRDAETAVRLTAAQALSYRAGRVEEGQRTLFQLLDAARVVEPQLRAKLLWGLGMLATAEGRFAAAVAPLGEALTLAEEADDAQTQGRALLLLANCAMVLHGPDSALPLARRSLALAEGADPWCSTRALAVCAWAVYQDGDAEQALGLAEEAVAVARRSRLVSGLVVSLNILGFVAGRVAESELAQAALTEALSIGASMASADARAIALTNLADIEMARGQFDAAGALLDEAVSSGSTPWAVMQPLLSLGRLAEARGDQDAAASRFNDVLTVGEEIGFASVQAQLGLGRVAARRGDHPASARRSLKGVLASAEGLGSPLVMADALHDLGELARTIGQHDRAATLHRRALRLRDEMADWAGVAGSLEALAGVSVDQQRHGRAARLFGAADTIRRENGLPVRPADIAAVEADLAEARRALGDRFGTELSMGGRLSTDDAVAAACSRRPSWRPTSGWASLTNAEREVVALVAEGLTNRQVGERLLISWRTVQTHLSHVFAKLGVQSRTELAARANLQQVETPKPR